MYCMPPKSHIMGTQIHSPPPPLPPPPKFPLPPIYLLTGIFYPAKITMLSRTINLNKILRWADLAASLDVPVLAVDAVRP